MQLDEQHESTFEELAPAGPPALAGAPVHVSFDDPRPYAQQIPKRRLAFLLGTMVALIVFGLCWRTLRSGNEPDPVAPVLQPQAAAGQTDAPPAPEAVEDEAPAAELTTHDQAGS